ncbi:MAG: biopolymer transporter ExbD [Betaproteobacteria bacterium]
MNRFIDHPSKKLRIELIPMVDVMMFLLVFFVLISINVISAMGLKTQLPVSSAAKDNKNLKRVVVTVPAEGDYQIDGKNVDSLASLTSGLQDRKASSADGLSVVINGDQAASLQRLVDVMGVLKKLGIDAMTISAKKSNG